MLSRHYPQVPQSAVLDFGGYRLFKPSEWGAFLDALIEIEYPAFYREHAGKQANSLWRSNACILESLEKYLFSQFGVTIPRDNLFKIYNQSGEGIHPELLLESIAAIIEPLGFEVERVIVPDPELRAALGDELRTVGIEGSSFFDGRPGLCMINIKTGESHAFYWENMDARRFSKEQFRLALTVKPSIPSPNQPRSPANIVGGFCKLLQEFLNRESSGAVGSLAALEHVVHALDRCDQEPDSRHKIIEQVSSLLDLLSGAQTEATSDTEILVEAGELVRKIFSEAAAPGVA